MNHYLQKENSGDFQGKQCNMFYHLIGGRDKKHVKVQKLFNPVLSPELLYDCQENIIP